MEGLQTDLRKANEENAALQKKHEDATTEAKVQADLAGRQKEIAEEAKKKSAELEKELANVRKRLEEAQQAYQPKEDEPKLTKELETRQELVEKMVELDDDFMEAAEEAFNLVVAQLTVLNPNLQTEGISLSKLVENGKLVNALGVDEMLGGDEEPQQQDESAFSQQTEQEASQQTEQEISQQAGQEAGGGEAMVTEPNTQGSQAET